MYFFFFFLFFCRVVACEYFGAYRNRLCFVQWLDLGEVPNLRPVYAAYRQFHWCVPLRRGSLWIFRRARDSIPRRSRGWIWERSQIWGQCTSPKPLGHRTGPHDNSFRRLVACEYFGAYGTRSRVVHVVGFGAGPKFEAIVRRVNPSAKSSIRQSLQFNAVHYKAANFHAIRFNPCLVCWIQRLVYAQNSSIDFCYIEGGTVAFLSLKQNS